MNKDKPGEADDNELRVRAERKLGENRRVRTTGDGELVPRLVQELQVHKIELEMQNEELQRARAVAEDALARYTDLYELAPVGYLTLDRDGVIRQVNLTGARLLGLERSRLVERRFGALVDQDSRVAFDALLGRVFEGQSRETCNVAMRREESAPATLELTASCSEDGQECRLVAVDVTDRERMLKEREALLARLVESDRLASMGILAAGVAHELNNPLCYVLYNIESLAEDLPTIAEELRRSQLGPAAIEDALDRLTKAIAGTHRIRDLARSLGTFAGGDSTEVTEVNVQHCIEQALQMALNEIRFRAKVVRDFAGVPDVLATDGKLVQVFLNLFIHAAQAIDEGSEEQDAIRVRTWLDKEQVCIEVSDSGRAIEPADQDRMFEPFFTAQRRGARSGLGLSICKNIVTSFGGEIGLTSEVGKGTRIVVRLPCAPIAKPESIESGLGHAAEPSVGGRVLVVDDEPEICRAFTRMLKREHEVVTASSGKEAQALLEKDRGFDLIFCDLMMPKMSGMQLHAWLLDKDPELAAQVVFVTGGVFTPGATEYLRKVGNAVVEKPIDIASVKQLTGERVAAAKARRG